MNKHILGISTYFLTFFLSVILVALFGVTKEPVTEKIVVKTDVFVGKPLLNRNFETVEQREIRKLLENDQTFGLEYYRRAKQPKAATELVEKMRELSKNSELPATIREAYKNHLDAWNDYAEHLESRAHLPESENLCRKYNNEISRTYNELLETASNFGVDFVTFVD